MFQIKIQSNSKLINKVHATPLIIDRFWDRIPYLQTFIIINQKLTSWRGTYGAQILFKPIYLDAERCGNNGNWNSSCCEKSEIQSRASGYCKIHTVAEGWICVQVRIKQREAKSDSWRSIIERNQIKKKGGFLVCVFA